MATAYDALVALATRVDQLETALRCAEAVLRVNGYTRAADAACAVLKDQNLNAPVN